MTCGFHSLAISLSQSISKRANSSLPHAIRDSSIIQVINDAILSKTNSLCMDNLDFRGAVLFVSEIRFDCDFFRDPEFKLFVRIVRLV